MLDNPVAIIVALIGSAGIGGFLKEIVGSVRAVRSGVSVRESTRKRDLVSERDYEYSRAELEARNRRRLEEYAAGLRRLLVENGFASLIPHWPDMEVQKERESSPSPAEADSSK